MTKLLNAMIANESVEVANARTSSAIRSSG